MLYLQGHRETQFLSKGNTVALSLTSLSGLFQGPQHSKAEAWLTPGKKQSPNACQVHCALHADTSNTPAESIIPLARAPAGRDRGAPGCQRSAPDRAPLGATGREARASRGRERPVVRTRRRASWQGGRRPEGEGRGLASRRGHVVARPQYLMSLCSPGLG